MDAGQIMMMPAAAQVAGLQLEGISQVELAAKDSGFDQLLTSVVQKAQKQVDLLSEKDAGSVGADLDLKQQEQTGMVLDPTVLQMMASLFAKTDTQISTTVNNAGALAEDAVPVGVIAEAEVQPQTKVEVQPQTKVEVQPQTRVEVQPQTRVEVQPQTRVEVQPQAKVEVQPQARVEVQPQTKVEVQPQAKVEVQPQARVEVQPQTRVEVQPQAKVEVQPQAKVEVQPQTKVEVQPQTKVEVQPQTRVEVQPQTRVEVQPQTKVEVQQQAKVEVQQQAKVEVQQQAKVEVQQQAKVEVQPQTKVEVQPQTKVEVQPQATKVEVQQQAKVEVQPQIRVEVQPQTRVEVQQQATKVEVEQTTKPSAAWLVYGRPTQPIHQAATRQQAVQVPGEARETGVTPATLVLQTAESDVIMPGLAVNSPDEAGMQRGLPESGTPHPFGVAGHAASLTVQGHTGEALPADSEKTAVSDQVAQQVVAHLKPSAREQVGDQSVTFRLSPEHLGDIQLSMHMDAKQGVKIEIVAENRGVRETLLQQADDLRETLARQNIKMDSFDVSTGLGGGASQQTRDWRQQQVGFQQQSQRITGAERNLFRETTEIPIRYIEAQYQSTLDVRF